MASGCEQHGQSCLDLKCLLNHFCLWSSPAWQSVSKVSWRHRTESAESRAVAANEKVKKTLAIAPDRLTSSPPGYNLEAYVLLETNHISLNVSRHLFHLVNHRDLEPRGWAVYKVEFWATICVVLTYIPSTSTPSIPTELFWLDASHPLTSPGSPSFTNRATCCSLSNHNYPLPSVCCSGPVITSAFFFSPSLHLFPFFFFEEKKIWDCPVSLHPSLRCPSTCFTAHTHTAQLHRTTELPAGHSQHQSLTRGGHRITASTPDETCILDFTDKGCLLLKIMRDLFSVTSPDWKNSFCLLLEIRL